MQQVKSEIADVIRIGSRRAFRWNRNMGRLLSVFPDFIAIIR